MNAVHSQAITRPIAANVRYNHGVGANQTSASSKGSNTSAVRTLCISMVSALRSGLRLRLRHGAVTSFATCVPGQSVAQQPPRSEWRLGGIECVRRLRSGGSLFHKIKKKHN